LNAQVNPNIDKCQLPGNGTKNMIGRIRVLKLVTQVQGLSSSTRDVVYKELGFKYRELLERLNLDQEGRK